MIRQMDRRRDAIRRSAGPTIHWRCWLGYVRGARSPSPPCPKAEIGAADGRLSFTQIRLPQAVDDSFGRIALPTESSGATTQVPGTKQLACAEFARDARTARRCACRQIRQSCISISPSREIQTTSSDAAARLGAPARGRHRAGVRAGRHQSRDAATREGCCLRRSQGPRVCADRAFAVTGRASPCSKIVGASFAPDSSRGSNGSDLRSHSERSSIGRWCSGRSVSAISGRSGRS